jgi:hypothetical protein
MVVTARGMQASSTSKRGECRGAVRPRASLRTPRSQYTEGTRWLKAEKSSAPIWGATSATVRGWGPRSRSRQRGEEGAVVDDGGRAAVGVEGGAGAEPLGDVVNDAGGGGEGLLADVVVEGAQDAFEASGGGDDVELVARADLGDGEHAGGLGVDGAAADGLERGDEVSGDDDGVDAEVGVGGVGLLALDVN